MLEFMHGKILARVAGCSATAVVTVAVDAGGGRDSADDCGGTWYSGQRGDGSGGNKSYGRGVTGIAVDEERRFKSNRI